MQATHTTADGVTYKEKKNCLDSWASISLKGPCAHPLDGSSDTASCVTGLAD